MLCPKCRGHYPDNTTHCPADGETLLDDVAFSGVDPDLEVGQLVSEYKVEIKIGAGGFGTVYRASHPLIGKRVAIKVLSRVYSSNPSMVSRFISEARAVNQIRHKGIIDIFSFGVLPDKRQYFIMEYLEGVPFDKHLKQRGKLSPSEAIPILRQIARALDAAHAAGIAHRDLKPENVFLSFDDDGQPFTKLLDFGIAKLLGDSGMSGHQTRTGVPIGTPCYMSPEQCQGIGVDHRADIYSFGVMTHEVLTGRLPFISEQIMTVMMMHFSDNPPPMSSHCADLPAALDGPVQRMMAKDPAMRPESVSAGLEELAQAARDAGLDVSVAPARRASGPISTGLSGAESEPRALTPLVSDTMLSAPTLPFADLLALEKTTTSSERSVTAMETSITAPTVSPTLNPRVLAVAAFAVIVVLGLALYFMPRGAPATRPQPADSKPARSTPAAVLPASKDPPLPETPAPSLAPAAPAEVALTIQSTPAAVEVFLGELKLGVAPGPVRIKRGEDKVVLSFHAADYISKNVEVTPQADEVISVALTRSAKRPTKSPKKKLGNREIENPF